MKVEEKNAYIFEKEVKKLQDEGYYVTDTSITISKDREFVYHASLKFGEKPIFIFN